MVVQSSADAQSCTLGSQGHVSLATHKEIAQHVEQTAEKFVGHLEIRQAEEFLQSVIPQAELHAQRAYTQGESNAMGY